MERKNREHLSNNSTSLDYDYSNDHSLKNHGLRLSKELEQIGKSAFNGEKLYVDEEGILHTNQVDQEIDSVDSQNFLIDNAADERLSLDIEESTSDELERLGEALINDEELYIDDAGVLHTGQDVEAMNSLNNPNMLKVNADPFA